MTKPHTTARQLNGLSGVRRSARRKCDERVGWGRSGIIKIQCVEIFTTGEADAIAANRTADLRKCIAQIAMLILRQRLIRALRLSSRLRCSNRTMRNTMHQAAQLREQQSENQQESGEQGTMHAPHANQKNRIEQDAIRFAIRFLADLTT